MRVTKEAPEPVGGHGREAEDEEECERPGLSGHGAVLQGYQRHQKTQAHRNIHIPV